MNTALHNQAAQLKGPRLTVLVTGGTGFLGAYVIRDLINAGYKVKALRRRPAIPFFIDASVFANVEWINCDITDPMGLEEAMQDVDAVIHSAAKVSFSEKDRAAMFKVNVEGTAN